MHDHEARHCNPAPQRLQPHNAASYFRPCQKRQGEVQWPRGAGAVETPVTRYFALSLIFLLATACAEPPPPPTPDAMAMPIDPHVAAVGRDPDPQPEALRDALRQFRDRFACNSISGCPAEATLLNFGWTARPYVQQVFDKAPEQAQYRARAVRVVAELRDPLARTFLRDRLQDADPETRAYAIFGLGLLDDRELVHLLPSVGRDDPTAWMAPVRLSALWLALRWGDPTAQRAFLQQLALLANQQMAVQGLVWGLTLCMRDDGPHCQAVLPLIARHPNFLVRRAVAKAMALAPLPSYGAGLVALTTESARSISEPAEQALRVLSRQDLHGPAEWRRWCAATGCQQAADAAIAALAAELTPTTR